MSRPSTTDILAHVVRPADLLVLSLHFSGLRLERRGRAVLLSSNQPATDALITVKFAPQSIGEQTFAEASLSPVKFPAAARLSGGSVCVFRLPAAAQPALLKSGIAFTLAEVLRLLENCALVPQTAEITDAAKLFKPPLTTLIEAPHRMLLSPEVGAVMRHSHIEASAAGRVPLWHTRVVRPPLGRSKVEVSAEARVPFGFPNSSQEVTDASPNSKQRRDIVKLTTATALGALRRPVRLNRLMLSALGAYLDAAGGWDLNAIKNLNVSVGGQTSSQDLNVRAWLHRLTLGRDQYVKVVEDGVLYPFGHRVSLITITERKFRHEGNGTGAYLRRRALLVVREPRVQYEKNRALPFKSVTLQTLVTPMLDDRAAPGVGVGRNIWVCVDEPKAQPTLEREKVLFACTATDWEGNEVKFLAPMIYLLPLVDETTVVAYLRKKIEFAGQKVAMAEPAPAVAQGTTVIARTMQFQAAQAETDPRVLIPSLGEATIELQALRQLATKPPTAHMSYHETWVASGGSANVNAGQVFARVTAETRIEAPPGKVHTGVQVEVPADKAGGLLAPAPSVDGLSRTLGAVAQANQLAQASVGLTPSELFAKVMPQLFGCIEISQIIGNLGLAEMPRLITSKQVEPNPGEAELTLYEWKVPGNKFKGLSLGALEFVPPAAADAFTLETKIKNPLSGGTPTFRTDGKLRGFAVVLGGMVSLEFDELGFTSENAKKPDVAVKFKGIKFQGVLSFVNALTGAVPLDGFSDPPFLDVTADGVSAGYTLGIPAVAMGAFNLSNVNLSASFFLPLLGGNPLALRFGFCEREQPCTLTVYGIGGGAFVAVVVSLKGVEQIEAAIEFGAAVAINLGVAAGTASIMAGLYMQKAGNELTLSGYLRANGHLSVLGLISVSVTLYMALAYQTDTGRVWGEAKVSVKVKVVFFSKTVSVRMEREFKGSDPSFEELMPRDAVLLPDSPSTLWNTYWSAFA